MYQLDVSTMHSSNDNLGSQFNFLALEISDSITELLLNVNFFLYCNFYLILILIKESIISFTFFAIFL